MGVTSLIILLLLVFNFVFFPWGCFIVFVRKAYRPRLGKIILVISILGVASGALGFNVTTDHKVASLVITLICFVNVFLSYKLVKVPAIQGK